MCVFQMVEKAEYRISGAQAIGKLVTKMPCENYATFVKWLYNYSLNIRVSNGSSVHLVFSDKLWLKSSLCLQVAFRMFALDVAMVLLAQEEREADETLEPDLAGYLSHRFLVRSVVYGRRSDVSPTVRAHAMHCLAQCLELPSHNATKWIHELFSSSSTSMLSTKVSRDHLVYLSEIFIPLSLSLSLSAGSQTMMETGRSERKQ